MAKSAGKPPLPQWTWSYVVFRFGDGLTAMLVPLAVILHYGLPLWALAVTTASMNLAGVPGAYLWGKLIDRVRDPRPYVVGGFALASLSMALLALLPAWPLYLLGAAAFTMFGVATGPAASLMLLQGVRRADWGRHTSRQSRRTGLAFLSGMAIATAAGFLGPMPFRFAFAAAAFLAASAAFVAARTVKPGPTPRVSEAAFDPGVVQAGGRHFERAVYTPARLGYLPNLRGLREAMLRPHRLWPLGYVLTFMGSVAFFTTYPGILADADHLALGAGLVLLCQAPSHIVTPITYPWAGRHGARIGESRGVARGAMIRMATLPLLMAVIVFVGRPGVPALLLLHGAMGLSFALIQVNGPLILAEEHPGGRGQGVGTYHASVGLGTLLGSGTTFVILRLAPYWTSYIFAVLASTLGGFLLVAAHRRRAAAAAPPGPQLPEGTPVTPAAADAGKTPS